MAYTVNRVYRCKERTGGGRMEGGGLVLVVEEWRGGGDRMGGGGVAGLVVVEWRGGGDRMWWVGVAGLVVVEWRGVIECGLVLVEFFGGIGGNRNGGWL